MGFDDFDLEIFFHYCGELVVDIVIVGEYDVFVWFF